MKRLLAPAPDDWSGLAYEGALAVNEVDVDGAPHVAVYFDDLVYDDNGQPIIGDDGEPERKPDDQLPLDETAWAAYVAAYTPPPPAPSGPALNEVAATIQASPDLTDEVKTALLAVIAAVDPTGAAP